MTDIEGEGGIRMRGDYFKIVYQDSGEVRLLDRIRITQEDVLEVAYSLDLLKQNYLFQVGGQVFYANRNSMMRIFPEFV